MPGYHEWGDEDFDWNALNSACRFFRENLHRWARFPFLGCKEKYGTMRFEYWGCTHTGVYGLFFPGRLYHRYAGPKIKIKNKYYPKYIDEEYTEVPLLQLGDEFITGIAAKIGVRKLFWMYQKLIFNIVTVIAVKKWSHIKDEILDEPEFDDLLYDFVKKKINYVCNWVTVSGVSNAQSKQSTK